MTRNIEIRRARGAAVRVRLAQLIWVACALCALVLAVGALCIALGANAQNPLVRFVLHAAEVVDLGVFSLRNGIFTFSGPEAQTRNALANWGLGAVAYLVVGRVLERIVRP